MKIGSLFSGIGGLELGLERAIPGAEVVWQVERDEYARKVLAKHWPEARRFEDVREVGRSNLASVDLVCGGFPCQDISNAGARAGIDGERSGLWKEFSRILGEMVPRFVVLENVSAITYPGRGLGRVLGQLAALGYDGGWDCIPASAVGAPHQRDRWFFVGWHRATPGAISDADGHQLRHGWKRNRQQYEITRPPELADDGLSKSMAHSDGKRELQSSRPIGQERRRIADGNWWATLSEVGRGLDGVPAGVHGAIAPWEVGIPRTCGKIPNRSARLRCLGNAVVPQVAEVIGRVVLELEGRSYD